ncbi:AmmeMemoRadiSam system protein B [Balneolaceae bacterium ANBcel3]|nr:AmmeMemoRadiSam system protein B [Balneolaceae bacterium ANBcel3]
MKNHNNKQDKSALLINDIDQKLPPVRQGVEMIPVRHEEREMIYFHDPQGYLVKPFLLDKHIGALLPMLNGMFSVREISEELQRYGSSMDDEKILFFIRQLDEARLLHSPWFRAFQKQTEERFEKSRVRPPVCAGQSYPDNKNELQDLMDRAFAKNGHRSGQTNIKALFAPHIDPRIGLNSYVPAFSALRGIQPKRVILLATSHYSGMYDPIYRGKPYIVTRKNFQTPLGTIETDQEALDIIERSKEKTGTSFSDRAHRNEHSIELHAIFLQYLWSHSFTIVPMLVGPLDELYYMEDGDLGDKTEAMASLLETNYGNDRDTLFLISGDLAHIGKKFGDNNPASSKFDEVKTFDREFLKTALRPRPDKLLTLMKKEYDPYRICGFPPLYTALKALPGIKGSITSYQLWDEREHESAVTYGSILYQEDR